MPQSAEKLLRKNEELRGMMEFALDRITDLPDWVDQRAPGPDRWSPLQIIEHLILSEREVLHFPAPFSEREGERQRLRNHLGRMMVTVVLKTRIPVPVPEQAMAPKGKTPLHRTRRMALETHDWLDAEISTASAETLSAPLFHHPVAGPLTLNQALDMNRLHIAAHLRQLKDLIAELTA
jgi:hypothetical protein